MLLKALKHPIKSIRNRVNILFVLFIKVVLFFRGKNALFLNFPPLLRNFEKLRLQIIGWTTLTYEARFNVE